jgi:hypothetical protein
VLDEYHRPGNVHDSNGAEAFFKHCQKTYTRSCRKARSRPASKALFFTETIAERLHGNGVEFTISVPFERFIELKSMIKGRKRGSRLNDKLTIFEVQLKPKS